MRQIDMIVVMDLFMGQLDNDISHKSFVKKIDNKLKRYFKRMHDSSIMAARNRIMLAVRPLENKTVSVAPLVWAIQNKYPDIFIKGLGMEREWFEKFNKLVGAQEVTMDSLRLITAIEAELEK